VSGVLSLTACKPADKPNNSSMGVLRAFSVACRKDLRAGYRDDSPRLATSRRRPSANILGRM
jgi:hypothetical protein